MSTKYVQPGEKLLYSNSGSAIASGDIVVVGNRIGVADVDIAASTGTGILSMEGVFELPKTTSQAWTQGAQLFYDAGTGKLTTTGTGNTPAGYAHEAAGSAATTGLCNLESMFKQAAVIEALAGTLTGSTDGTIVDTSASACAGGSTPTAAQVDTAIASLATSTNLQLKEIQTVLNALIAAQKVSCQMANS